MVYLDHRQLDHCSESLHAHSPVVSNWRKSLVKENEKQALLALDSLVIIVRNQSLTSHSVYGFLLHFDLIILKDTL
jgi:hypothetical protein